jgi:hypothetical protein
MSSPRVNPMTELKKVDLGGVWRAEAEGLKLELQKLRSAVRHNATSGAGAEEALRDLLQKKLPTSIGVTQGQVFDSTGTISRQSDVILYDATRTPLVFESAQGGTNLVPVEGVIAVIEVKSNFSASDLESVVANMSVVKSLEKSSYFGSTGGKLLNFDPYQTGTGAVFPIIYSLFAYESASLESMLPAFVALNESRPVNQRIDNACFLDKACMLNETPSGDYEPLPSYGSAAFLGASADALLFWYLATSAIWLQASHPPINMLPYAHNLVVPDDNED